MNDRGTPPVPREHNNDFPYINTVVDKDDSTPGAFLNFSGFKEIKHLTPSHITSLCDEYHANRGHKRKASVQGARALALSQMGIERVSIGTNLMPLLSALYLDNNNLGEEMSLSSHIYRHLRVLSLRGNKLRRLYNLSNAAFLERLILDNNSFESIDVVFETSTRLEQLKTVSLLRNPLYLHRRFEHRDQVLASASISISTSAVGQTGGGRLAQPRNESECVERYMRQRFAQLEEILLPECLERSPVGLLAGEDGQGIGGSQDGRDLSIGSPNITVDELLTKLKDLELADSELEEMRMSQEVSEPIEIFDSTKYLMGSSRSLLGKPHAKRNYDKAKTARTQHNVRVLLATPTPTGENLSRRKVWTGVDGHTGGDMTTSSNNSGSGVGAIGDGGGPSRQGILRSLLASVDGDLPPKSCLQPFTTSEGSHLLSPAKRVGEPDKRVRFLGDVTSPLGGSSSAESVAFTGFSSLSTTNGMTLKSEVTSDTGVSHGGLEGDVDAVLEVELLDGSDSFGDNHPIGVTNHSTDHSEQTVDMNVNEVTFDQKEQWSGMVYGSPNGETPEGQFHTARGERRMSPLNLDGKDVIEQRSQTKDVSQMTRKKPGDTPTQYKYKELLVGSEKLVGQILGGGLSYLAPASFSPASQSFQSNSNSGTPNSSELSNSQQTSSQRNSHQESPLVHHSPNSHLSSISTSTSSTPSSPSPSFQTHNISSHSLQLTPNQCLPATNPFKGESYNSGELYNTSPVEQQLNSIGDNMQSKLLPIYPSNVDNSLETLQGSEHGPSRLRQSELPQESSSSYVPQMSGSSVSASPLSSSPTLSSDAEICPELHQQMHYSESPTPTHSSSQPFNPDSSSESYSPSEDPSTSPETYTIAITGGVVREYIDPDCLPMQLSHLETQGHAETTGNEREERGVSGEQVSGVRTFYGTSFSEDTDESSPTPTPTPSPDDDNPGPTTPQQTDNTISRDRSFTVVEVRRVGGSPGETESKNRLVKEKEREKEGEEEEAKKEAAKGHCTPPGSLSLHAQKSVGEWGPDEDALKHSSGLSTSSQDSSFFHSVHSVHDPCLDNTQNTNSTYSLKTPSASEKVMSTTGESPFCETSDSVTTLMATPVPRPPVPTQAATVKAVTSPVDEDKTERTKGPKVKRQKKKRGTGKRVPNQQQDTEQTADTGSVVSPPTSTTKTKGRTRRRRQRDEVDELEAKTINVNREKPLQPSEQAKDIGTNDTSVLIIPPSLVKRDTTSNIPDVKEEQPMRYNALRHSDSYGRMGSTPTASWKSIDISSNLRPSDRTSLSDVFKIQEDKELVEAQHIQVVGGRVVNSNGNNNVVSGDVGGGVEEHMVVHRPKRMDSTGSSATKPSEQNVDEVFNIKVGRCPMRGTLEVPPFGIIGSGGGISGPAESSGIADFDNDEQPTPNTYTHTTYTHSYINPLFGQDRLSMARPQQHPSGTRMLDGTVGMTPITDPTKFTNPTRGESHTMATNSKVSKRPHDKANGDVRAVEWWDTPKAPDVKGVTTTQSTVRQSDNEQEKGESSMFLERISQLGSTNGGKRSSRRVEENRKAFKSQLESLKAKTKPPVDPSRSRSKVDSAVHVLLSSDSPRDSHQTLRSSEERNRRQAINSSCKRHIGDLCGVEEQLTGVKWNAKVFDEHAYKPSPATSRDRMVGSPSGLVSNVAFQHLKSLVLSPGAFASPRTGRCDVLANDRERITYEPLLSKIDFDPLAESGAILAQMRQRPITPLGLSTSSASLARSQHMKPLSQNTQNNGSPVCNVGMRVTGLLY